MKKRKLVIVMRTDLGMTPGKMIAQAGHAIVQSGCWEDQEWIQTGMKKVTLQIDSEDALMEILAKATLRGCAFTTVLDAGLTQVEPGTPTCIAIGPDEEQVLKKVTGSLKLL